MRRIILATTAGAVLLAGGIALAAPAIADPGPSPSTIAGTPTAAGTAAPAPTALTPDQQDTLDEFLATHPGMASRLVARIERWEKFADENPELVAELKRIATLPVDERRDAARKWLDEHPDDRDALRQFRDEGREIRAERRNR